MDSSNSSSRSTKNWLLGLPPGQRAPASLASHVPHPVYSYRSTHDLLHDSPVPPSRDGARVSSNRPLSTPHPGSTADCNHTARGPVRPRSPPIDAPGTGQNTLGQPGRLRLRAGRRAVFPAVWDSGLRHHTPAQRRLPKNQVGLIPRPSFTETAGVKRIPCTDFTQYHC